MLPKTYLGGFNLFFGIGFRPGCESGTSFAGNVGRVIFVEFVNLWVFFSVAFEVVCIDLDQELFY